MPNILEVLAIVVLIILSAFFSSSETAYAAANGMRIKRRMEEKNSLVNRFAYYIYENYGNALTSILIGNNLVNTAASAIMTVIVIEMLGDGYEWVATVVMTVLLLIFGEIMPKVLAKQVADVYTAVVAMPLRIFMMITKPVIVVVMWVGGIVSKLWEKSIPEGPAVTEDDLENIIDTAEDEGVIDEERSDLLQSALDFDDVMAYEIITPRVDMVAIDIDDSFEQIMEIANESTFSRIPVYEDTVDNIIGILHLNHLFKKMIDEEEVNIRELLMPAYFVHKTMTLQNVLEEMKKHNSHMVIVTDEYGGTMGVLTMEDVLEQLVGDIWDESDEVVDEFTELADDMYEADGSMRIYDFFEELDIDDRDFDDDNATLGGWAIEMLGGYPKVGDSFEYKNLTITVKKLKKHRVDRLVVKVSPVQEEAKI